MHLLWIILFQSAFIRAIPTHPKDHSGIDKRQEINIKPGSRSALLELLGLRGAKTMTINKNSEIISDPSTQAAIASPTSSVAVPMISPTVDSNEETNGNDDASDPQAIATKTLNNQASLPETTRSKSDTVSQEDSTEPPSSRVLIAILTPISAAFLIALGVIIYRFRKHQNNISDTPETTQENFGNEVRQSLDAILFSHNPSPAAYIDNSEKAPTDSGDQTIDTMSHKVVTETPTYH